MLFFQNKKILYCIMDGQRITTMAYKNRGSLNVEPVVPQKKVTYDDILSSLNMQVVNGKLQIIRNQVEENRKNGIEPNQYNQNQYQQNQNQNNQNQYNQQQNYLHEEEEPEEPVILSPDQIKRIRMMQYIKQVQQQKRIREIKSTKMVYSNANVTISSQYNNINHKLFHFK